MCFFNTIVHQEGDEYWAEVPALPGCYAMGASREELEGNIRTAISMHLAELNEASVSADGGEFVRVAL